MKVIPFDETRYGRIVGRQRVFRGYDDDHDDHDDGNCVAFEGASLGPH